MTDAPGTINPARLGNPYAGAPAPARQRRVQGISEMAETLPKTQLPTTRAGSPLSRPPLSGRQSRAGSAPPTSRSPPSRPSLSSRSSDREESEAYHYFKDYLTRLQRRARDLRDLKRDDRRHGLGRIVDLIVNGTKREDTINADLKIAYDCFIIGPYADRQIEEALKAAAAEVTNFLEDSRSGLGEQRSSMVLIGDPSGSEGGATN